MKINRQGFTLIELLVVVLIIGILAAIALPQYQKAVIKARFAAIKPTLAALKQAEEYHYLVNGEYATDMNALDINANCQLPPTHLANDNSIVQCGSDVYVDAIYGDEENPPMDLVLIAYFCPAQKNAASVESCMTGRELTYKIWLDHSAKPGQIECIKKTALGEELCKSL